MDEMKMCHSFSKCVKNGILTFCFILLSANCFATNNKDALTNKIHAIEKKSNAIIGITAIHIEKNQSFSHNSSKRFFMASTIKLPIAMAFLNEVDKHNDSLNRQVKLDSHNSVPGSGALYHIF